MRNCKTNLNSNYLTDLQRVGHLKKMLNINKLNTKIFIIKIIIQKIIHKLNN